MEMLSVERLDAFGSVTGATEAIYLFDPFTKETENLPL